MNPSGLLVEIDGKNNEATKSLGFEALISPPHVSNVRGVDEGRKLTNVLPDEPKKEPSIPQTAAPVGPLLSPVKATPAQTLLVSRYNIPRDQLHSIDLFGGAMRTVLPKRFRDVSDVRQVPDHQEVWQDIGGAAAAGRIDFNDAAVVVEILDYQNVADKNSIRYFFEDLADGNGCPSDSEGGRRFLWSEVGGRFGVTGVEAGEGSVLFAGGSGLMKVEVGESNLAARAAGDDTVEASKTQQWVKASLVLLRLKKVQADLLLSYTEKIKEGTFEEEVKRAASTPPPTKRRSGNGVVGDLLKKVDGLRVAEKPAAPPPKQVVEEIPVLYKIKSDRNVGKTIPAATVVEKEQVVSKKEEIEEETVVAEEPEDPRAFPVAFRLVLETFRLDDWSLFC